MKRKQETVMKPLAIVATSMPVAPKTAYPPSAETRNMEK
ncbi:MAG: hypothetical protein BWY76_03519 [bacterium ADurb.Bin429]|nr:MAG: hypothetical protein BWY76_03519 [bacterium ADurb.Bin429]